MTINPKILALVEKASATITHQPPLGGSIHVDFGSEGGIFVDAHNGVLALGPAQPPPSKPDCTISLSLDELAKLQSGEDSIGWDVFVGKVHIDNRALAEKAAALFKGAA